MAVMEVTNRFEVEFEDAPQEGFCASHYKHDQKPTARELIGPRVKLLLLFYQMDMSN